MTLRNNKSDFNKYILYKTAEGEFMDFEVILERRNSVIHNFYDGEYQPYDDIEDPAQICGEIIIDNKCIGSIRLYELYNDDRFRDRCDSVHGDVETVASAICGKSGAVLKKYLSEESAYDYIYILDEIRIDKEYRNCGIGSVVIKNLFKMLNYQFDSGSTIFLCASDFESAAKYGFESEEYKNGKKRLIQFYKRMGFRVVKDNIMVNGSPL